MNKLTIFYFLISATIVASRNVPRYSELDDDDQQLFRAAYETPSYDHDEYQEEEDMPMGKLDLLKDGLWAVKAKIKELKAFDKALAANLLATKLKIKDLLKNHLKPIKEHHHEKPSYNYQAPSYEPQYAPQYAPPQQYAPVQQYAAPQYAHDPYYGH